MTPLQQYQHDLRSGLLQPDPAQLQAVEALDALYQRLCAPVPQGGPWRRLLGPFAGPAGRCDRGDPRGLYLWGGVGRGKTHLMDLFHGCLPAARKRRLHFHRFMQQVHHRLRDLKDVRDPLALLAADLAGDIDILCLDEFHVSDITDAMLLSGLLSALLDRGVMLVTTSNLRPSELYRGGLQRERFLPAIALLEQRLQVLELVGAQDYRLRILTAAETWHVPADATSRERLASEFQALCGGRGQTDGNPAGVIPIEGREIPVVAMAADVIWFDFEAICGGPRSQMDYIELARLYPTVLVSNVPVLDGLLENEARRLISLVDEFYDRGVKLLVSADAVPEQLYRGARHRFEFERTVSRLQEMQSVDYLHRPHRP